MVILGEIGGDSVIWNVKIIKETKQVIIIGYSKGSSFDGIIEYDKRSEKFKAYSIRIG